MTRSPDSRTQRLLEAEDRAERLAQMAPDRRAQYESITQLREGIGVVGIGVARLVREIREE